MARKRQAFTNGHTAPATRPLSPEARQQMIAEAAYYRALARGFQSGDPIADWLQAEKDVDNALLNIPAQHTLSIDRNRSVAQPASEA